MINEKAAKKKIYQHLLMTYWLVLPLLFVVYLILKSQILQLSMEQMLIQEPHLAVMLLLALLTPLSSYLLREVGNQVNIRSAFSKSFFKFSIVQQLIVGNIIGGGLTYLTFKESRLPKAKTGERRYWKGYLILAMQGICTLIALLAFYTMLKNK